MPDYGLDVIQQPGKRTYANPVLIDGLRRVSNDLHHDVVAHPRLIERELVGGTVVQHKSLVGKKPAFEERCVLRLKWHELFWSHRGGGEIPLACVGIHQQRAQVKIAGSELTQSLRGHTRNEVAAMVLQLVDHHRDVVAADRVASFKHLGTIVVVERTGRLDGLHVASTVQ